MSKTLVSDQPRLLLTGATGYLGSHILRSWLSRNSTGVVYCPVRGENAPERLKNAVVVALRDAGEHMLADDLMQRVKVIHADILVKEELERGIENSGISKYCYEVIHGAANLSFKEEDREAVIEANVSGTSNLLEVISRHKGVQAFNYVSTAYVAGTREGVIRETDSPATSFNNAYEESKSLAECLVRKAAAEMGVKSRVFRPSIIIGHTRTLLSSSSSGLYKVVEMLYRQGMARSTKGRLAVPYRMNANINLIPVDIVVDEMLEIMASGNDKSGVAYHLTNERPLSVEDVLFGVTPMTGITMECSRGVEKAGGRLERMLMNKGLSLYLPYLSQSQIFNRNNVRAMLGTVRQDSYWLDLVTLRRFVSVYLEDMMRRSGQEAHPDRVPAREVAVA